MKSIFDGSIQESTPFGGQSDRNFSMSQFKQFIFSSKSMMCVKLNSLGLHVAHNCVISNIFYCHISIWHLPFISRHTKWKMRSIHLHFHPFNHPLTSPYPVYVHFYLNLRRVAIKTFPIEFPVSSCYCPGDCTFLFLLCIFIPYKHNRPSSACLHRSK